VSEPQQPGCVAFAGRSSGAEVPGGPIHQFTRTEIAAMIDGVKNGEFDYLR
jgi:hypothetical protein